MWYGFNTGKIQKFGRLFLKYDIPCPVHEWIAGKEIIEHLSEKPAWQYMLKGLSTDLATTFQWADSFFDRVRKNYSWLVKRSGKYLKWRFHDHPDHSHTIILVKKWGKVTGYLIVRMENDEMLIGDALFYPSEPAGFQAVLSAALKHAGKDNRMVPVMMRAWFFLTPSWWIDIVKSNGFISQRERNHLDLCVTVFNKKITYKDVAEKMYFTWGDSDLF